MSLENIIVKGARENNLKNINTKIPRNKFVVVTGVSGSGKSSLAFDTIYAEGQRRYVESLSAYARQFLGRMVKPDVDYIEGLSPAISIDQKGTSHNPRSTVGTVTEVYDYLRLLFARVGKPHCPKCQRPVQRQTIQEIVDEIIRLPPETRFMVLAPVVRDRKGEYKDVFESARKKGFVRVRVDGQVSDLSDEFKLSRYKQHTIEIVVDRLVASPDLEESRVYASIETAMKLAQGIVSVAIFTPMSETDTANKQSELLFSEHFACPYCKISLGDIEPRTFSFNSPHGACQACTGLGFKLEPDPELVIPNERLTINQGAIAPWRFLGTHRSWTISLLRSLSSAYNFSLESPIDQLPEATIRMLLYGNEEDRFVVTHTTYRGKIYTWETTFEGIIPNITRRFRDTESEFIRRELERYMARLPCIQCRGRRLNTESLAVLICGENIMDVASRTIEDARSWINQIGQDDEAATLAGTALADRDRYIAKQILKEIENRLRFLLDVGLDYLTLERMTSTLSGGEAQRIRLATQIGSGLMGVLYVCDEPTIGLHPADDQRLIDTLKRLRDLGNTVLIVEHDEAIMRAADHIVDLGPGAGESGGYIVAEGPLGRITSSKTSITGAYLSGRRKIPIPSHRRRSNPASLIIKAAQANNLKSIDVSFPLGRLICVTGISGSGKSSLVYEVLYKRLAQDLNRAKDKPGAHLSIEGIENIDKVVNIDQSPIGRTPRSNPTTYTGAFTPMRELYSQLPEARSRGYRPGRFSFNVRGGRCESCEGAGYIQIEMQFLPDVTVPCETCNGLRYNREALEVKFRDASIADVLNMSVSEALSVFQHIPKISSRLETLKDVGLGYIRMGQPATTLSGGEAQRVKLATELSRRATGRTVYILDEPTTGLSFEDTAALLRVLHRLVDTGNTVIVIEHHLDVIKNADWIIDLGPGAGLRGGQIIVTGTPEKIARSSKSATGLYLQPHLNKSNSCLP